MDDATSPIFDEAICPAIADDNFLAALVCEAGEFSLDQDTCTSDCSGTGLVFNPAGPACEACPTPGFTTIDGDAANCGACLIMQLASARMSVCR